MRRWDALALELRERWKLIEFCRQLHWIITWIERRLEKGTAGDETLLRVEQLIAEIYHWFDGEIYSYTCATTRMPRLQYA